MATFQIASAESKIRFQDVYFLLYRASCNAFSLITVKLTVALAANCIALTRNYQRTENPFIQMNFILSKYRSISKTLQDIYFPLFSLGMYITMSIEWEVHFAMHLLINPWHGTPYINMLMQKQTSSWNVFQQHYVVTLQFYHEVIATSNIGLRKGVINIGNETLYTENNQHLCGSSVIFTAKLVVRMKYETQFYYYEYHWIEVQTQSQESNKNVTIRI